MTKIWGPSSARRISFGSPTSRTNCTPIRRFQKWMNLLQVINFVIWWCIFEILFCLEAQYQGDSWNCCEVISNLQDELRMDNVLDQLHNNSIYLNGRISYRWWFWLQMKINVCTRAWILSEVFPKKPSFMSEMLTSLVSGSWFPNILPIFSKIAERFLHSCNALVQALYTSLWQVHQIGCTLY